LKDGQQLLEEEPKLLVKEPQLLKEGPQLLDEEGDGGVCHCTPLQVGLFPATLID
jgi:hypothetical protein